MWTSFCNFLCNKLFNRPEIGFRRSDDSNCGVYGKRLKLIDRIWNRKGLLNRANSSCTISMQKVNTDISDDEEDCCIIAEIPRRKKASSSMTGPRMIEMAQHGKNIQQHKSWSEFSFQKDLLEKNTPSKDIKEVKLISKFSGKDENTKLLPKKFFNTQRTLISSGKLARSRLSYRDHLRKRVNFLQESYRLAEKLQYVQLLRSHTTLMSARRPLKGPEKEVEVIDLSKEETDHVHESTFRKNRKEEQDVQIVGEVTGVRSFQDMIKFRPLNVEIALRGISSSHCNNNNNNNNTNNNAVALRLPENIITLEDENNADDNQKTDALEEKLRNFMQITGPVIDEVENSEPHYLPGFTSDQERKIKEALISEPRQEVLSSGFGLQITRQDMQTLVGLNWLNDEIINYYLNLIMERNKLSKTLPKVYAFNTFFYPKLVSCGYNSLRRWTKQVEIFSFDIILVPIHLGMHWCLSVIDFRTKSVNYYDSIGSPNDLCLERLLLYLKAESLDKRKKAFITSDWEKSNVENIPQQMNGGDCGVFSCMFAEYLSRDCIISFTQDDMPYFRKKMVIEILEKKLLT